MGFLLEMPAPLEHKQEKGILIVCLAARVWLGKVERGKLLAPRRVRRFLMEKRVSMAESVVTFEGT